MKQPRLLFLLVAGLFAFGLGACTKDECPLDGGVVISSQNQSFSVTYLNDSGYNYITDSIWNWNGLEIWRSEDSPSGQWNYFPDDSSSWADGKFGPVNWSTNIPKRCPTCPGQVEDNISYDFYYLFKKEHSKPDTFRITYLLAYGECYKQWSSIKYYQNGDLLEQYTDQEIVNLVITE